MVLFIGLRGKFCELILSCISVNSVIEDDAMIVNHVDVSNCGISLWEIFISSL